jgi:hypothetical protein
MITAALMAAALTAPAYAQEDDSDQPWSKEGMGWGGVPALNYNSDEGFGYGVLGSLYFYDGKTAPYDWSTTFLIFLTTKKIQTHRVDLDFVDFLDKPLRLSTRVEFYSTRAAHYCGTDLTDYCDDVGLAEGEEAPEPAAAADALGLEGQQREDFLRRYYKLRYMNPNAFINARYKLSDKPHRFEIMGGWRGGYLLPGDFEEDTPFEGSLYAQDFPEGEEGFYSTFQLGVMLDNRDNEPSPSSGYWIEGSGRGGFFTGTGEPYYGFNTTLRGYLPLLASKRLVLASREIVDGVFGDPPVPELTTAGGSQSMSFFGGQYTGRGVRSAGLLGKARFFAQNELRWTALSFKISSANIDLGLVGFADVGYVAADWSSIGSDQAVLFVGEGGGLRVAVNKNFIVRLDVGFSALEANSPGIYINVNNLF